MKRMTTAIALVGVALAAGCGGDGGGGGGDDGARAKKDVAGVRATAKQYLTAIKDSEFGDACGLMTDKARNSVSSSSGGEEEKSCEDTLAVGRTLLSNEALDQAIEATENAKVTLTGDSATMEAVGGNASGDRYAYVDGKWHVDAAQ